MEQQMRERTQRRRTNNNNNTNDYVSSSFFIHDSIIAEILLRTPASSVLKFKYVCKQWCSIIKDPQFIRKHVDHPQKNPSVSFAVLCKGYNYYDGYHLKSVEEKAAFTVLRKGYNCYRGYHLKTVEEKAAAQEESTVAIPETCRPWSEYYFDASCVWQCNGLFCFFLHHIHICNPTTKEFVTLPVKPSDKDGISPWAGFGYDAVNKQYKMVEILNSDDDHNVSSSGETLICYNVFTLGDGSKSWRTMSSTVSNKDYPRAFGCRNIHVGGSVYWLIKNLSGYSGIAILCFDVREEKFRYLRFSHVCEQRSLGPDNTAMVGGLNDKRLRLLIYGHHIMDMWMLKEEYTNTIQDSWIKEHCIDVSSVNIGPDQIRVRILRIMNNKLFLRTKEGFASYDLQSKRTESVVKITDGRSFEDVYMQNMISLHDLMMQG